MTVDKLQNINDYLYGTLLHTFINCFSMKMRSTVYALIFNNVFPERYNSLNVVDQVFIAKNKKIFKEK